MVSSLHFKEDDYRNTTKYKVLLPTSVPSVFPNYPAYMREESINGVVKIPVCYEEWELKQVKLWLVIVQVASKEMNLIAIFAVLMFSGVEHHARPAVRTLCCWMLHAKQTWTLMD